MASSAEGFCVRAVKIRRIRGSIDGQQHTAALTYGDGACGLHAVFGSPRLADKALEFPDARNSVWNSVPEDMEEACAGRAGGVRGLCLDVLKAVWADLALPAARAQLAGAVMAETTAEMRCIWEHTPAAVRDELCSFAQAQSFEQAKSMAKKNQLMEFAKKLFAESNEAALVRPLCVLLGYLQNADQNYLHGRFPPMS